MRQGEPDVRSYAVTHPAGPLVPPQAPGLAAVDLRLDRPLVAVAPLTVAEPAHARLIGVLRDLLTDSRVDGALLLPLPVDRAALEATNRTELPVPLLCNRLGISRRTLERRFLDETGMTFGQWRRRARMLAAVRDLAAGATVAAAAQRSGYATPSAFSAAFRAELGTSPSKWSAPSKRSAPSKWSGG